MNSNKPIVPKSSKRSLELILRENPNMTAKQILAEQKYDEDCYNMWAQQENAKQLETVEWLKSKRYFKIEYIDTTKLVIYLEITNAQVTIGQFGYDVIFDAISSSMSNRSIVKEPDGINITTKQKETYQYWENYVTGNEKVTVLTKEQYNTFHTTIDNLYNL